MSDQYRMGLTGPFADRLDAFLAHSKGAVEPLQGRMDSNEYKTMYNRLMQSDPELAAEMGNVHETPFTRGTAALLHYPVDDQWALRNAARYGLRLRPGFNNIVEPAGLRHKNRPTDFSTMSSDQIRNHLMEIIEGAVQPDVTVGSARDKFANWMLDLSLPVATVDDDRNPEKGSLDAPLLANQSPVPQIDPTAFRDPDKARSSWDEAVDWWLSHNFFDEDVPSGGGLMVGPQEMAKLGNFLKDALLPLMAGDVGLAGVGGLGPFDPLPIPVGQIVGKGVKGAKGIWRAIRGGDEAVEAVSAVVRAGDDLTPSLLRSQGFLGDARLAPTRNIGKGVTVSEMATTGDLVDRPFVIVRLPDGRLQPFYRSSGYMSGQADEYFPFDGFGPSAEDVASGLAPEGWYRKGPHTSGAFAEGTPNHRYGSFREVSELLSRELGDAEPTVLFDQQKMSYDELNEALGTYVEYEDYVRATREQIEAGATTANPPSPMRVETPAGPTVIDLDAPQPDLPPGTALGPDGEVIRIMGLEDEAADAAARAEMQAAREAGGKPAAPASAVDDLPVPEEYLGELDALYEKGELIIANPTVGDLIAKADELEGKFWAKIESGFESLNKIHADDSLIGIDPNESAEYIYTSVKGGGPQSIFRQLAKQGEVDTPYIVSNKAWEAGDDLWEAYVDDFLTRYPDQDPIIFLSREVEEYPPGGYRESGMQWSHLDAIGQSVREWLEGYSLRKTARTVIERSSR